MRRNLIAALGSLALGCLGSVASAQTTLPPAPALNTTSIIIEGGKDAPIDRPPVERAPLVAWSDGHAGGDHDNCWRVFAGGGVNLVAPRFERNQAFYRLSGGSLSVTSFNYDFEMTPQAWVGVVAPCGLGARAKWWRFDHAVNEFSAPAAAGGEFQTGNVFGGFGLATLAGERLSARYDLRLDVYDFDITQNLVIGRTDLTIGGGVRYLDSAQRYDAAAVDATGAITASIAASERYSGVGPTVFAEARRGICASGFALYANSRGSLVFGERRLDTLSAGGLTASLREDSVLPIGEAEVGVEYAHKFGRFRVVGQGGFVGSIWCNAHNASPPNEFADFAAPSRNIGFVGLALRLGVSY